MQQREEDGKMAAGAGQLLISVKSSGCQIFYFPVENGIISLYPEGENDRDGRKGYEAIQGIASYPVSYTHLTLPTT